MHYWGDKSFDWLGLDKAIDIIEKDLRFWRISVRQTKEKFGTARIYCRLGWYCLLDITHPGYTFYRYPKWLMTFDIFILSRIIPFFNFIVLPIHKKVYHDAYKKAVIKYPHLKEEICCMADYVDLLSDFYISRWKTIGEENDSENK